MTVATVDPTDGTAGTAGTAGAADAHAELTALQRAGRLVAEYPRVERLLGALSGEQLLSAGRLLARLSPDEVAARHPAVPVVGLAVTGHGTLGELVPALTGELARHGMVARTRVADFDSYVFDLCDPGSDLYAARPDLVLCVLDPEVVFDEVPVPWGPADVERVFEEKTRLLVRAVAEFTGVGHGTLVLNTLPLQRRHTAQLVDHASRARLGAIWREGNARLLRLAEGNPAVVVLDLDPILAEGTPACDARMNVYAKAHLSRELLAGYAREVGHLARHLAGRTKKCLALDLDGTVWGGVLGDDGPQGIEVAESYRGEAYRAFQRVAKQIGSQGVLLAAVSKNDVEPVREVLRDHPMMTLREGDFVRVTANWRPKHDNLKDLAQTLNLGVDSFVFADDSPYECGLVGRELPQVAVVRLDGDPALHVARLLHDGWFDVCRLTAEDRKRAATYADELVRADFLQSFDSLADYLRELDVRVRLARVGAQDAARVAQLTQRTNQFNLTTVRLQQADVQAMADDPERLALAVHAGDRFGENGLVGAVLGRWDGGALHLENFVLSCRVFSRGIELACMASVLRYAKAAGATAVLGGYRPTAKNTAVKDFYPRCGFTPTGPGAAPDAGPGAGSGTAADGGGTTLFRHDLAEIVAVPEHVHLTESL